MKFLKYGVVGVVVLYCLIASAIFVPLNNWRYAQDNGVVKWVLFGEIVATAKAVIWPYYVFAVSPTAVSNDYPKLNANETDVFSRLISKAQTEELNDGDIAALKSILRGYSERTGTKMTKADVDAFTKDMEIANEYGYELGQSLLMSWDSKSRFTTGNFDNMLKLIKESGRRKPELIKKDLACLDAAARNQSYIEDEEGRRFHFGRELMLQQLRENEIARKNFEKIKSVLGGDSVR